MHPLCSLKARKPFSLACIGLAFGVAALLPAQAPESSVSSGQGVPGVEQTLSSLAHRVLKAGQDLNGLTEAGESPWHLLLEYQLLQPGYPKPIRGSMEEWYAGPHRWKRTWEGVEPSMSGTVWSIAPYLRFTNHRSTENVEHVRLDLHVARPAVDPLLRAALIRPEDPMDIKIVKSEGITLNCVSVLIASHNAADTKADPRFPTFCFDKLNHLRLASTENLAFELEDFQLFDKRAVAHHVKALVNHRLVADIRVKLLEPLSSAETAIVHPPRNAIAQPFLLEPGFAVPQAVYEAGAHLPLQPDGYPYRGRVLAMLLIRKDGSVKVDRDLSFAPSPAVLDSIELAVRRWRYQPYTLDGEAREVKMVLPYPLDGKPYLPSYKRVPPLSLIDPEDYLDAEVYADAQGGGPARRRRGR